MCSALTSFCINDLGGFYLDIIKDRQYTTKADSQARRSHKQHFTISCKHLFAG
ncbi:hypothetical protein ABVN80_19060 [Acinetobacter baumannii]